MFVITCDYLLSVVYCAAIFRDRNMILIAEVKIKHIFDITMQESFHYLPLVIDCKGKQKTGPVSLRNHKAGKSDT